MDTSKYENKMEYRRPPVKPRLIGKHTSKDAEIYVEALKEYETELEDYKKWSDAYRKETHRLENRFKIDALDDVGLLNHPKADKIYSYAKDKGYSSGLYEVYNELCELADLFLD